MAEPEQHFSELSSSSAPTMHLAPQTGLAFVKVGLLDKSFLVNPYTDPQGQEQCEGMIISTQDFKQLLQEKLRKAGDNRSQLNGTIGKILFDEFGSPQTQEAPLIYIRNGLTRYQDRLKFAVNGYNVDPNDLVTIRDEIARKLSVLQGLFDYQHDRGVILTLPANIAAFIPETPDGLNKLADWLSELNSAAKPYLPLDQQDTIKIRTQPNLSPHVQGFSLSDKDRAAIHTAIKQTADGMS